MKKAVLLISLLAFVFLGLSCTSTSNASVYKSSDAGENWSGVVSTQIKGERRTDYPHGNVYSLAIDPTDSKTLYVNVINAGIYKTTDNGQHWQLKNSGIYKTGSRSNSLFQRMVINPTAPNQIFIAGLADNFGKVFRTNDAGQNWQEVFVESASKLSINGLAVAHSDPKILLAGGQNKGLYRSVDSGDHWQTLKWFDSEINSIAIDLNNSNIYFVSLAQGSILRSDDAGQNWRNITAGLSSSDQSIGSLILSQSPQDSNTLFLGSANAIYVSHNRGDNWQAINSPLSPQSSQRVLDLAVDPKNQNIIYFSLPGIVYRMENQNSSWFARQLPIQVNAHRLLIDPNNSNTIYAGVSSS